MKDNFMKKNKNKIFLSLIIILLFSLTLNTATAKAININDASSYNQTDLSLSEQIQAIINNANAGDTINFLGNYYKDLTLIINKNINIISKVGTTISNSNLNSSQNTIFFINGSSSSGTNISGFNLINNNTNGNGITINNTKNIKVAKNNIKADNSGVYVDKGSNITVNDNNITKSEKGVYIKNSKDINIEKNSISENNEGISVENTNNTNIKSNAITKSEKNGITIKNTRKTVIGSNSITQNKKNGIYSYNTVNTQITSNNIKKNVESGILTEGYLKDLIMKGNNVSGNYYGIRLNSIDNSGLTMRSNSINNNYQGLSFGSNYEDHSSKDISSNDISQNEDKDVDARESKYDGNLKIGPNWYGANEYGYVNICHKIDTNLIQFKFVKNGNGKYTATLTYNGIIMSDLPQMNLLIEVNGKTMWVTLNGGEADVDLGSDFDKKNKDSIINTYLSGNLQGKLRITDDKNDNKNPIVGGNNNLGNGGLGGNGPGGNGLGNLQGNGLTPSGATGPTSTPSNTGSPSSKGENSQNSQQQSQQAKEIFIDDNNILKMDDTRVLTGFIIILLFGSIIIGYIVRNRAKENSF